jgi:hypothetical protein
VACGNRAPGRWESMQVDTLNAPEQWLHLAERRLSSLKSAIDFASHHGKHHMLPKLRLALDAKRRRSKSFGGR